MKYKIKVHFFLAVVLLIKDGTCRADPTTSEIKRVINDNGEKVTKSVKDNTSAVKNSMEQVQKSVDKNGKNTYNKLDEILKTLKRKTDDSKILNILQRQEVKFAELESKIQECEQHKNEDYQRLAQRLFELETRLNITEQENIDLRATMDILHDDNNDAVNDIKSARQRRNFLASSTNLSNGLFAKKAVAFDAYRNGPFDGEQSIVTYDGTSINAGNGLNISSGIFTAPVSGIYAFNFHALTRDGSATYVKIMLNGRNIGGSYRRHEGEGDENTESQKKAPQGLSRAEGMLAQSVVLQLEESDKVGVFAYHGNIRDGGWHYTHFTGYLLF